MFLSASVICLGAIAAAEAPNIFRDLRQAAGPATGWGPTLAAKLHWTNLGEKLGPSLAVPPRRSSPVNTTTQTDSLPASTAAPAPFQGEANAVAPIAGRLQDLGIDPANVQEALVFYRAGNLDAGDGAARAVTNPIVRTALEWIALRDDPEKAGLKRLEAFSSAHPDWPAQSWLRAQVEAALFRTQNMAAIRAAFAASPPHTSIGKLAFARALKAEGQNSEAAETIRALYRTTDMTPFIEGRIRADFGSDLQKSDYKFRADRLLYKDDTSAALRIAALGLPTSSHWSMRGQRSPPTTPATKQSPPVTKPSLQFLRLSAMILA